MGINWLNRMPREILETNRKDVVAWWLVRNFEDEWGAKRAFIQWSKWKFETGQRRERVDGTTIRSVMEAIRTLREKTIPWYV